MGRISAWWLILFLFGSGAVQAQFSVGGRVGINGAAEKFTGYTHLPLARFYLGATANYKFKSPWAFQVELNASGEGSTVKNGPQKFKDRQTYFNVPLLVQYKVSLRSYFEAGPQLGFLLTARENYGSGWVNEKSSYKGSAPGFMIGYGREIKRTLLGSWGINIRYMRSIAAINQTQSNLIGGENIKNRVLSVGVTYKWEVTN